jgi:hypothetical protein
MGIVDKHMGTIFGATNMFHPAFDRFEAGQAFKHLAGFFAKGQSEASSHDRIEGLKLSDQGDFNGIGLVGKTQINPLTCRFGPKFFDLEEVAAPANQFQVECLRFSRFFKG